MTDRATLIALRDRVAGLKGWVFLAVVVVCFALFLWLSLGIIAAIDALIALAEKEPAP